MALEMGLRGFAMTPKLTDDLQPRNDVHAHPAPVNQATAQEVERRRHILSGLRAEHAFRRDLVQLLEERPGQWVAYHGEQRVGFAPTKTELYLECLRRGWKHEEFVVHCIEPDDFDVVVPPLPGEAWDGDVMSLRGYPFILELPDDQQPPNEEPPPPTPVPQDPERRRIYLSGLRAEHAFRRDLVQLLEERPGQWVAYHGEQRVGFAPTKTELYLECLRRGWKHEEFVVHCIEPDDFDVVIPPLPEE
jgi:hypothetical protein